MNKKKIPKGNWSKLQFDIWIKIYAYITVYSHELSVFRFVKKMNYSYCIIIPRIFFKCTIKKHKAFSNVLKTTITPGKQVLNHFLKWVHLYHLNTKEASKGIETQDFQWPTHILPSMFSHLIVAFWMYKLKILNLSQKVCLHVL